MRKSITINAIEFTMLQELAKKSHVKPDQYLKNLIKSNYDTIKR